MTVEKQIKLIEQMQADMKESWSYSNATFEQRCANAQAFSALVQARTSLSIATSLELIERRFLELNNNTADIVAAVSYSDDPLEINENQGSLVRAILEVKSAIRSK